MPYRGKKRKKTRTQKEDSESTEKMPQSIVARKGSVGITVQELVKNFRMIMAPNTASHLTERRTNSLKDYINIAGPYGVTHIILFTKMRTLPRMRIGCFPQGPTLHFRVEEYTLIRDLLKTSSKGVDTISPYYDPPIVVLNNFPDNDKPLQLVCKTFQNMFPAIDPEKIAIKHCRRVLLLQYDSTTSTILLRHYGITRSATGVGQAVASIVKKSLPDLHALNDISEFILRESAGDGAAKQAVRLRELGPRMRLSLLAVEGGLFGGELLVDAQNGEEKKEAATQRAMEKRLEKKEVAEAKEEDAKKEAARKKELETKREVDREREARKKEKKERMEKKEMEKKGKVARGKK
ncbi:hypothetical protein WA588_003849 [Blastocystis sp. NMH]